MNRRVWITGVGLVTSAGIGVEATWDALLARRTGMIAADSAEAALVGCPVVATVKGFKARNYVSNRKSLKLMTRPVKLGMAAAKLAFEGAGLEVGQIAAERIGIYVGAGQAFADRTELEYALKASRSDDGRFDMVKFGAEGLGQIHPLWLLRGLSNNVLGFVSLEYDAQGTNNNFCNSGVSATQAVSNAARAIADGHIDAAFAGGYDSIVGEEGTLGFGRLGLLAKGDEVEHAHRPFDVSRTGLVPAEGAAFLILEAAESAKARGATGLAAVLGGGSASDAMGVTGPDPSGGKISRSVLAALDEAGGTPEDVVAVFAHGTGSAFDAVEARAYREVFGARASSVLVTADKATVGHTVAACGAVSAGLAAWAISQKTMPPIASLDELDPRCEGLAFVAGGPVPLPEGLVVASSAGIGGQGAAVVLAPL